MGMANEAIALRARSHMALVSQNVYVLIQAHVLIEVHAPGAQNTSHQIQTKCLIKHSSVISVCLAAAHVQIATS